MKTNPRFRTLFLVVLVVTIVLESPERASANATYSGTTSGTFSNPVLSGIFIDENGNNGFADNTATAVFTGFSSNSITWGDNLGTDAASTLTFTGANFTGVQPGQTFELGTITYFNGTSLSTSLIFGGMLTLTASITPGTIDPAVSHLTFTPVTNTGINPKLDADFVRFDVFPTTFNVLEGATASANLFGAIVGDPQLQLTDIQIAPGSEESGFLGHGRPSVPDGGTTFTLLSSALAVLFVSQRKTDFRSYSRTVPLK
jgi:VPDSG-CTERM motif